MASGCGKRFGTGPWFAEPKLVDYAVGTTTSVNSSRSRKSKSMRARDQRTGIGHNQSRQL
jgi:hypothetical protein